MLETHHGGRSSPPRQEASTFLNSLPNNPSSSTTLTTIRNQITDKFTSFSRRILQNERTRKFVRKSKEFFEFVGEFSRKDLLNIVLKQWKAAVLCFVFGILIGFVFLSHSSSVDYTTTSSSSSSSSGRRNTLSFPLPDGFNEKETLQDNFELLRHFYLTHSRHLLRYEGGPLDAFTDSIETIKDIGSTLLFKNYTLKSKPIVLKELGIGWRAKREWYKIDYLNNYKKKEELFSVEKDKNGIFYGLNIEKANFEKMNFKKLVEQLSRNQKLLLSIDLSRLSHLVHDVPKWPSVVNGFFTHISTHALITSGKATRLLKSNNYETFYCQIVGKSELLLYDPFQTHLLYPHKNYPNHATFNPYNSKIVDMRKSTQPLSRFAKPLKAKVSEGDCLFIPSYWYYAVSSSSELTTTNPLNPSNLNIVIEYYYSTISNAHKVAYESILRGQ